MFRLVKLAKVPSWNKDISLETYFKQIDIWTVWIDRQTEMIDSPTDGQTDRRRDGQKDGRTDGRTDGRPDGRTDGRTDVLNISTIAHGTSKAEGTQESRLRHKGA